MPAPYTVPVIAGLPNWLTIPLLIIGIGVFYWCISDWRHWPTRSTKPTRPSRRRSRFTAEAQRRRGAEGNKP